MSALRKTPGVEDTGHPLPSPMHTPFQSGSGSGSERFHVQENHEHRQGQEKEAESQAHERQDDEENGTEMHRRHGTEMHRKQGTEMYGTETGTETHTETHEKPHNVSQTAAETQYQVPEDGPQLQWPQRNGMRMQVVGEAETATKRAVARRACLSCREKKIKCDGEALTQPEAGKVPTCSNCKFFGIDCVFVQSMRGGRRRKRHSDVPAETDPKFIKLTGQEGSQFYAYKDEAKQSAVASDVRKDDQMAEASAATPSMSFSQRSSFGDLANLKLPSPTLSYASTYYDFPSGDTTPSVESELRGSFRRHKGHRWKGYHNEKYGHWRHEPHHFKGHRPHWKHHEFGPAFPPPPPPFPHPHHGPYPPFPYYAFPHPMAYGHDRRERDPALEPALAPDPFGSSSADSSADQRNESRARGSDTASEPQYDGEYWRKKEFARGYDYGYGLPPYDYRGPPHGPPPPHGPHGPPPYGPPPHIQDGVRGMDIRGMDRPGTPGKHGFHGFHGPHWLPPPHSRPGSEYRSSPGPEHPHGPKSSFKRPFGHGAGPGSYMGPDFEPGHIYAKGPAESVYSYTSETAKDPDMAFSDPRKWDSRDTAPMQSSGIDRQIGIQRLSVNDRSNTCGSASSTSDERDRQNFHLNGYELEENDLPTPAQMQELLDYYYDVLHPQQMVLPPKQLFLKWVPLSSDSSVYHAMIATICDKKPWRISRNPQHWIAKMEKLWDNLSDYGMVLCYFLASHTSTISNVPSALMANMAKCWNIVQENKTIEALNKDCTLNARKSYERESLLRIIWWLSVGSLFYRFSCGPSFSHPQITGSDPMTVDYLKSRLPFPSDKGARISLDDYNSGKLDSTICVLRAVDHGSKVLDQIGKSDRFLQCEDLEQYFVSHTPRVERDHVVVDSFVATAQFIKLATDLFQYGGLLDMDVFGSFFHSVDEMSVPAYNAADLRRIQRSDAEHVTGLAATCRKTVSLLRSCQGLTASGRLGVFLLGSEKPLDDAEALPLQARTCIHSLARAIPFLILYQETSGETFGDAQLQDWLGTVRELMEVGSHAGMRRLEQNLEQFRTLARGVAT